MTAPQPLAPPPPPPRMRLSLGVTKSSRVTATPYPNPELGGVRCPPKAVGLRMVQGEPARLLG